MWNTGKPKKSAVVIIREMKGKGVFRDSIAVYDENEGVFYKNGQKLDKVNKWRYKII